MNLYKITAVGDPVFGNVVKWEGTQLDSKAAVKALQDKFPLAAKPEIEPVDFPTDKPGLLAWLNANFGLDNGQ